MTMDRVLVTGASGFVGKALVERMVAAGCAVNAAGRSEPGLPATQAFAVGAVDGRTDWSAALAGCTTVMHLAAQVPLPGVPDQAFEAVNDHGTARLVEQAAKAGVTRFVLMSSVFAVIEHAAPETITERTLPTPTTAYGRSKRAAEGHVMAFDGAGRTAIALRPPLVYGAGLGGNWRLLQRLAASGLPLPFGAVRNRRSLIALDNLVDAALQAVTRPAVSALSGVYLIADREAVSLRQMLIWLREGMGLPPRLLSVPPALLASALRLTGRSRIADSLLGDLAVDTSLFHQKFDWQPPIDTADGIRQAGAGYRVANDAGRTPPRRS